GRLQRGARGADQLVQLVADGRLVPAQAVHHRVVGRPVRRRLRVGEQAVAGQVHPGTPAGYQGPTRDDGHDRDGLVHWPTFGSDTGTTGDGSAFHAGREGRATSPRHSTATLVPLSGSSAAVSGRPASSKNISVRVWAPSANSSTGDVGRTVFTRYGTTPSAAGLTPSTGIASDQDPPGSAVTVRVTVLSGLPSAPPPRVISIVCSPAAVRSPHSTRTTASAGRPAFSHLRYSASACTSPSIRPGGSTKDK